MTNSIEVFIKSEEKLTKVTILTVTKYGIYNAKIIDCKKEIVCSFSLEIVEEMMPQFRIEAYFVKDKDSIATGIVQIVTANLGPNHVRFSKIYTSVSQTIICEA